MRSFLSSLWLLTQLLGALFVSAQQWPLHDNGLNQVVQWDRYSLIVNGERLFMWSGEIHYWRVPVPELWIDILEKVKAAGFNTFSLYAHWGYHSPNPNTLDFESGAHNFTRLFDIAKDLGLYVIFRPGPYINAETTAGGFPPWVTTGAYGTLRNNDTRYTEAWTPYMERISQIVAAHSVTNGGNVIMYQLENEYGQQWLNVSARTPNETAIHYMELLEAAVRRSGIDIPTLHNNPNLYTKSWSQDYDINNVGGDVDIYSVDNYPSCWSCNLDECLAVNGAPPPFTVFDYYTHFQEAAPTQPSILAEFQGGSYLPWGGPRGGCVNNTGPDWVNIFYRNNVAQKVAGVNLYMLFGGTSWGGLPTAIVGTSYDYSAPISETRMVADKYSETKLLSYFLRAAKDLTMVERTGNGTNYTTNPAVFTQALHNVDTGAGFYVTRHLNSTSQSVDNFKLTMSTSLGSMIVPQYADNIVLNGRQSKIMVSDFTAGPRTIIYSTAEILAVSIQNQEPIVVFWVPTGESGEFYLRGASQGSVVRCDGCSNVDFHRASEGVIASFTQGQGMTVMRFDNGVRAVIVDRTTAYEFWQPTLTQDPHVPLDQTIFVRGPHLVRTAALLECGHLLALTGDFDESGELEVFVPSNCVEVTFNGMKIPVRRSVYGSVVGQLQQPMQSIESVAATLPALSSWKVMDGLPERMASYHDSGAGWVAANHTSTLNPWQPETFPVLYADEYGFHTGNLLWRGRFNGNQATGVYLKVIGGTSSGWSAWLNGVYLGSILGTNTLSQTNMTLTFGNAVREGENVLFVIQDHMGKDQTTGALNPRGILNATLIGGGSMFTSWRVAGNAGGEANIDPVRGPLNEGGLHAERLGWHLPGCDDSEWAEGTPEQGLTTAGANFYRTVVTLDMPRGYDVTLGFELNAPAGSELRAQLYVNGYMFGKFVPHIGNQVVFPVFPGIIDYHGDNTIGLSLWAQDDEGARMSVNIVVLGVLQSSFDSGFDASYLRPGWTPERLQYY